MFAVFAVLGLLVGSYLNVLIYRLPRRLPTAVDRSRCAHCGQEIQPRDLIPVVSFLLLRGRCRQCAAPIGWRYPAVELLTVALFVLVSRDRAMSIALAADLVLVSIAIAAAFIDFEFQIIPNRLLLGGAVLWILLAAAALAFPGWAGGFPPLRQSLIGAAIGGGFLWLVEIVTRGGMGWGDIKFMALAGLFLGGSSTIVALFVGFVLGAAGGLVLILLKLKTRKDFIPFGPYLSAGVTVAVIWGAAIARWYTGGVRIPGGM